MEKGKRRMRSVKHTHTKKEDVEVERGRIGRRRRLWGSEE
ncbi:uncharacterized protein G2W53_007119 [Senna tora]|uniref:Uncharacterized protein n=1 Tax=Senna tora TaxID=362788 RepID=A0A835CH25_9FABA|nr:uncharacterized protein G2W53_007119 [Senna tora]